MAIAAPAAVPGFQRRSAEIGGVRLSYLIGGDPAGPPVLLWHGFLGTSYAWRKVAPLLAARGHAVLAPDMRGYGDSDKPAGPEGYDGMSLADDFRRLVAALGFGGGRSLVVAAHDMGAPPALLWAARHPDEVRGLVYMDEPVLLPDVMAKTIAFTPEATAMGGLWWWAMALAPDVTDALVVGRERAFLVWFYDHYAADRSAIEGGAVDEYLRSFSGKEGVDGAFGVYRAIFGTIKQTARLADANKVKVPVVALGGDKSIGDRAKLMMAAVAERVTGGAVPGCGHFIPEERPEIVVEHVEELTAATGR